MGGIGSGRPRKLEVVKVLKASSFREKEYGKKKNPQKTPKEEFKQSKPETNPETQCSVPAARKKLKVSGGCRFGE